MIEINDNASMVNHKMSGRASILFFYAKWQEESLTKDLMELLTALCTKFPTITFLKIDAENLLQISEQFRISVVPSFVALHNQIIVGKVEGAHPSDLSKLVKQLAALDSQAVPMNSISASQEEFPVPLNTTLRKLISTAPVMLFMKGCPTAPRCGFSRQITEILTSNNIPYASFDILTDENVRAGLKTLSDWPTFPQLYVHGDFVGGLDIVKEIATSGNLASELGIDKQQLPLQMPTLQQKISALINQATVMVFIKGTPNAPQCGFSRSIVDILNEETISFSSFDILRDEEVRAGLKTLSDWPTYPQLYVKGEFIGGLDIIKEMKFAGPLRTQLGI